MIWLLPLDRIWSSTKAGRRNSSKEIGVSSFTRDFTTGDVDVTAGETGLDTALGGDGTLGVADLRNDSLVERSGVISSDCSKEEEDNLLLIVGLEPDNCCMSGSAADVTDGDLQEALSLIR
jgi:hypothetical protein